MSGSSQGPRYVNAALAAGLVVSGLLLGGAHLFEAAGYAPCDLCLDQREAHWAAMTVAAGGLLASMVFKARFAAAAALGAVALVYLLSAGLAFYHTGVEYEFWPGPPTCSAGTALPPSGIDLAATLAKGPAGPSCSVALWRFGGISMAGYNLLASAGLFALSFAAAVAATRDARRVVNGKVFHV